MRSQEYGDTADQKDNEKIDSWSIENEIWSTESEQKESENKNLEYGNKNFNPFKNISASEDGSDPSLQDLSFEKTYVFSPKKFPGQQEIVYPVHVPVRDYQKEIVLSCIETNCLVVLPTGSGKTFISAVVMYNFMIHFQEKKVIFLAPTKPLVEQQRLACISFLPFSNEKICVLTGIIQKEKRRRYWNEKNVLFCTPQVAVNDLKSKYYSSKNVICVVFDEAHHATGNYDYTILVKKIKKKNINFRIVGLTATPGNNKDKIQEVIKNLLISKIEFRIDVFKAESLKVTNFSKKEDHKDNGLRNFVTKEADLKSISSPNNENYSHTKRDLQFVRNREIELIFVDSLMNSNTSIFWKRLKKLLFTIIVELNELEIFPKMKYIDHYITYKQIMMHKNSLILKNKNIHGKSISRSVYFRGLKLFGFLLSLQHLSLLLLFYGLEPFWFSWKKFIETRFNASKPPKRESLAIHIMDFHLKFKNHLDDVIEKGEYLEPHPKIGVLKKLLEEHFASSTTTTKAIVFTSYKSSVNNIMRVVKEVPSVRALPFIGQTTDSGHGTHLSQRLQELVIKNFRSGEYNVLVSTCIGEEGLDIGEVDLIIIYDQKNDPKRTLQRFGRTGRKRQGKVFIILDKKFELPLYKKFQKRNKEICSFLKNYTNTTF